MGRINPLDADLVLHPAALLSLSLMVTATAATIGIITGLCGFFRKSSPQDSEEEETTDQKEEEKTTSDLDATVAQQEATTAEEAEEEIKGLPPPPPMTGDNLIKKSYSTRRIGETLTSKMSMKKKHFRSVSVMIEKNRPHLHKHEENLWQKTIILGEKCKVPNGADGDQNDGSSGNENSTTVPATRPRIQTTISRSSSLKNLDTIDVEDNKDDKGMTRTEGEGS